LAEAERRGANREGDNLLKQPAYNALLQLFIGRTEKQKNRENGTIEQIEKKKSDTVLARNRA